MPIEVGNTNIMLIDVIHGIEQSMFRKRYSPTDGLMESFFGILKRELFYEEKSKYTLLDELHKPLESLFSKHPKV